jgi:hypothetical protein
MANVHTLKKNFNVILAQMFERFYPEIKSTISLTNNISLLCLDVQSIRLSKK